MGQKTTFGQRLAQIMKHYGLNKNSLTVKIGLSTNSVIGRIVNEETRPSFEVLHGILVNLPAVNARWLITEEGSMLGKETASSIEKGEIRYYKGGTGDPFPEENNNTKPTALLTLFGFVDCQYAFDVFGDSMAPKYLSGDIILCSDCMNKSITAGESYYMVINGNPVIRIIKSVGELTYKLSAENPRIDDYEVKRDSVSHIYQIKGMIRREAF